VFGEQGFFLPQSLPINEETNYQGQKRDGPAANDCRAEDHEEDARVDGVAHETIRPAHNQFVVFLEGDGPAPIAP